MPSEPPRKLKVASAYFALLGYSQETIAKKIHRTPRTQQLWKKESDWPSIEKEAKEMFTSRLSGYARRAVRRGLARHDGGWLALNILERFDDDWLPPKQRVDGDLRVTGIAHLPEMLTDPEEWPHAARNGT